VIFVNNAQRQSLTAKSTLNAAELAETKRGLQPVAPNPIREPAPHALTAGGRLPFLLTKIFVLFLAKE